VGVDVCGDRDRGVAEQLGHSAEELTAEASHLWVVDKTKRLAWLQKLIEDLDSYLADEGLDPRLRVRYTRELRSLLHDVSELVSELPSRIAVEGEPVAIRSHLVDVCSDRMLFGARA
jgi:hypothetical protein